MHKNSFFLIFLIIILLSSSVPANAFGGRMNYDLLYKDMPVLNFMYEDGYDPQQEVDYNDYVISPYVLIRISDTLRNKKVLLQPGYYLVKPEKRDGYEFLLFKQNGRVVGAVPVFQKVLVNPALVYKEPPKPKVSLFKRTVKTVFITIPKKIITFPFKKFWQQKRVKVPPKSMLDSKVVDDGKYMEIWLYVDTYLYKVLFLIEEN